jgi:hypothetical protein
MAKQIEVYFAVNTIVDGEYRAPIGKMSAPLFTKTLANASPRTDVDYFSIAAGEQRDLYDYAENGDFELFVAYIVGTGYLSVGIFGDAPTDPVTDLTASGTAECWSQRELSCLAPLCLDTDETLVHPTGSDAEKADFCENAAGDVPNLWSDADRVAGKVYKIRAWNQGDDPVALAVFIVN